MQNIKAKMHQIRFWLGFAPGPAGAANIVSQTPRLDLRGSWKRICS